MKLVALMPVRNEDSVLGLSARVVLMWCDALVLYLHACTDRSLDIASEIQNEHPGRVSITVEQGAAWDEMRHRQAMLEEARRMGATHIAIVDADEVLTGNLVTAFRHKSFVGINPGSGRILQIPLYNLRGSIHRYHQNGLWGNRIVSLAFADDPALGWSGDRFHAREPQGKRLTGFQPIAQGDGGVMHLWGASERRLLAKHALYKVTERLRWPEKDVREIDRVYSMCIKGAGFGFRHGIQPEPRSWAFTDVPESWWAPYAHLMRYLDVDAVPWQEQAVRDAVAEHGREKFAGLDLFGVA